jgi:hypothetical protein
MRLRSNEEAFVENLNSLLQEFFRWKIRYQAASQLVEE